MPNPRDDLAALLDRVFDEFEPAAVRDEIADAILARWRLVPVEEQHRAADELTHHDQTAGHYDELPPIDMHPLIGKLRSDVTNGTACACGRTDQHGPHED